MVHDATLLAKLDACITSFDKVNEWADLAICIQTVHLLLQNVSLEAVRPKIPQLLQILWRCTDLKLPSGVHTKALQFMLSLFEKTPPDVIKEILPQLLLPIQLLFGYGNSTVKSLILELYNDYIVDQLDTSEGLSINIIASVVIVSENLESDEYAQLVGFFDKCVQVWTPKGYVKVLIDVINAHHHLCSSGLQQILKILKALPDLEKVEVMGPMFQLLISQMLPHVFTLTSYNAIHMYRLGLRYLLDIILLFKPEQIDIWLTNEESMNFVVVLISMCGLDEPSLVMRSKSILTSLNSIRISEILEHELTVIAVDQNRIDPMQSFPNSQSFPQSGNSGDQTNSTTIDSLSASKTMGNRYGSLDFNMPNEELGTSIRVLCASPNLMSCFSGGLIFLSELQEIPVDHLVALMHEISSFQFSQVRKELLDTLVFRVRPDLLVYIADIINSRSETAKKSLSSLSFALLAFRLVYTDHWDTFSSHIDSISDEDFETLVSRKEIDFSNPAVVDSRKFNVMLNKCSTATHMKIIQTRSWYLCSDLASCYDVFLERFLSIFLEKNVVESYIIGTLASSTVGSKLKDDFSNFILSNEVFISMKFIRNYLNFLTHDVTQAAFDQSEVQITINDGCYAPMKLQRSGQRTPVSELELSVLLKFLKSHTPGNLLSHNKKPIIYILILALLDDTSLKAESLLFEILSMFGQPVVRILWDSMIEYQGQTTSLVMQFLDRYIAKIGYRTSDEINWLEVVTKTAELKSVGVTERTLGLFNFFTLFSIEHYGLIILDRYTEAIHELHTPLPIIATQLSLISTLYRNYSSMECQHAASRCMDSLNYKFTILEGCVETRARILSTVFLRLYRKLNVICFLEAVSGISDEKPTSSHALLCSDDVCYCTNNEVIAVYHLYDWNQPEESIDGKKLSYDCIADLYGISNSILIVLGRQALTAQACGSRFITTFLKLLCWVVCAHAADRKCETLSDYFQPLYTSCFDALFELQKPLDFHCSADKSHSHAHDDSKIIASMENSISCLLCPNICTVFHEDWQYNHLLCDVESNYPHLLFCQLVRNYKKTTDSKYIQLFIKLNVAKQSRLSTKALKIFAIGQEFVPPRDLYVTPICHSQSFNSSLATLFEMVNRIKGQDVSYGIRFVNDYILYCSENASRWDTIISIDLNMLVNEFEKISSLSYNTDAEPLLVLLLHVFSIYYKGIAYGTRLKARGQISKQQFQLSSDTSHVPASLISSKCLSLTATKIINLSIHSYMAHETCDILEDILYYAERSLYSQLMVELLSSTIYIGSLLKHSKLRILARLLGYAVNNKLLPIKQLRGIELSFNTSHEKMMFHAGKTLKSCVATAIRTHEEYHDEHNGMTADDAQISATLDEVGTAEIRDFNHDVCNLDLTELAVATKYSQEYYECSYLYHIIQNTKAQDPSWFCNEYFNSDAFSGIGIWPITTNSVSSRCKAVATRFKKLAPLLYGMPYNTLVELVPDFTRFIHIVTTEFILNTVGNNLENENVFSSLYYVALCQIIVLLRLKAVDVQTYYAFELLVIARNAGSESSKISDTDGILALFFLELRRLRWHPELLAFAMKTTIDTKISLWDCLHYWFSK